MKRGTPDHPKTKTLARELGIPRYAAVGLLEGTWHFTARHAIRGNIGKWSDSEIADGVGWDGDPKKFVDAMVSARFFDRSDEFRIVVHDWCDHADDSVRKTLKNRGESFATSSERFEKIPENNRLPELTTYQAGWLYRAIDRRYSTRGKVTIVTVNVANDAEADKRMGAATWDRLCHGAWRVRCEWPSFRQARRNVNC
jgi:hypothetical protein